MEKRCPVEVAVELLGGKWKLPIIHSLVKDSPKRFKQLEREITGITPAMLTNQLRMLENAKLVKREVYATVPPTVEYSLTDLGKSTRTMILALEQWGQFYQERAGLIG